MMYRAAVVVLSIALGAEGLRKTSSKSVGSPGQVDVLYTYGAAKTSLGALTNPLRSDGCFPGWRIVNRNDKWWDPFNNVDLIPTLLGQVTSYAHVKQPVQFIDQKGVSTFHECGWSGSSINFPDMLLHPWWTYVSRADSNDNIRVASVIGLDNSYNSNVEQVAGKVAQYGWNLVSATWRGGLITEVVHLMQNPRTNACILTFGGTDTVEDIIKDVVIIGTSFCGLQQRVHTGFKWELMGTVKEDEFQSKIRPKLSQCSALEVVGHSMGGATAALFTACLHSRPSRGSAGYDDYKWISFNKDRSMTMEAIAPVSATSVIEDLTKREVPVNAGLDGSSQVTMSAEDTDA